MHHALVDGLVGGPWRASLTLIAVVPGGGGKEMSINILALSLCLSAVVPWWHIVGTAAERCGFVYRVTA